MGPRTSYEAPEVVPRPQDAPEVVPKSDIARYDYSNHPSQSDSHYASSQLPSQYSSPEKEWFAQQPHQNGGPSTNRKRRKWWIIGIVSLIVVAAVVGGAVGGTLSSKKSKNARYIEASLHLVSRDIEFIFRR